MIPCIEMTALLYFKQRVHTVVSKMNIPTCKLEIGDTRIKHVQQFKNMRSF